MIQKRCPFRTSGDVMSFGYPNCSNICGLWDEEHKQCSIVTIAGALSTINSNIHSATNDTRI